MAKLTERTKEVLDNRYVAYDPEQQLDGPDSLVNLVCPLHGAYEVALRRLDYEYVYRNLKAPGCPGCRYSKLPDSEYRRQVKYRMRAAQGDAVMQMLYQPDPAWRVLDHWIEPNL